MKTMNSVGSLLIVVVASGCDYKAPIVPATDPFTGAQEFPANVISGTLVLGGPVETPGPAMVFVTDAANPMPPYGTGRPFTVGTVPAEAFTSDGTGAMSAPYSVSGVPNGEWIVTAMMDVDRNFSPFVDAMSGATCGDVAGAHLADLDSRTLGTVVVADGAYADDVSVLLGTTLPFERPAFTIAGFGSGGNSVDPLGTLTDPTSQRVTLVAQGIGSAVYTLPGPTSFGPGSCGAIFPVQAPDADGDGEFDPHPSFGALGLKDLWPKVYLEYLGVPGVDDSGALVFANDLAEGESWAAEAVPSPAYALTGLVLPGETAFFPSLEVAWLPAASHTLADGNEEIVMNPTELPKGAWSVSVVSFTGQTWTVPNELAGIPAADGVFEPASQLVWIEVE